AENGIAESVESIKRDLGSEIARTTLSLIPGEPVDLNNPEPSIQSEILLGNIKMLRNNPFTLDELNLKRALHESVKTRVILEGEYLNVAVAPLRNARGDINLHYAVRLNKPEDFAIAQADQRYYYSIELLARVMDDKGKQIYARDRKLSKYIGRED